MHRLYHDFNKLYPGETEATRSAPLVCFGTKRDLDAMQFELEDGMEVLLYQPDDVAPDGSPDALEVAAKIRYDSVEKCFMADFVWEELMYRSEREAKESK